MTVMVEMPSALRQFADNQDELDSDGKNVEEVLADLCGRFPELKQNLYEDEGSIRNFINIYVNDEDIRYADGMQTGLKDGDRIQIVPSIAGGYWHSNCYSLEAKHETQQRRSYALQQASDVTRSGDAGAIEA